MTPTRPAATPGSRRRAGSARRLTSTARATSRSYSRQRSSSTSRGWRLSSRHTSWKVGHMTSAHAVRMYELLAQHRGIGTRTLNLAWLRDALQIEPGEYKLTADFKKWVIDASVEQINKHSDITVGYKPKKTGRAITDFVFKIKDKERKAKASTASDQAVREKLEALGQQRLDTETDEEF